MTPRPDDSPAPRGAMWAWAAAGVLWALVWIHGTQTHGFTAENERRLWLGATWMDSSKLLCLSFAAVAVGLYLLGKDARIGRVARWLWALLLLVIAVQAVAVLVANSPFPWGSYEMTFNEVEEPNRYPAVVSKAGIAQAMGSLIAALLSVPEASRWSGRGGCPGGPCRLRCSGCCPPSSLRQRPGSRQWAGSSSQQGWRYALRE